MGNAFSAGLYRQAGPFGINLGSGRGEQVEIGFWFQAALGITSITGYEITFDYLDFSLSDPSLGSGLIANR